jgi:uncharacterized protein YbbC (DUF1343 family)
LPIRHGLTLGEAANWFKTQYQLDVELKVISMPGYDPNKSPYFGWIEGPWVNPSPNLPTLFGSRSFPGTVLLEGTTLSEGRGTTRPLELFGAPDLDSEEIYKKMLELEPEWLQGCDLRPCYFEPTFHKHVGKVCQGFQIHTDTNNYNHDKFKPYRLMALVLKAVRTLKPDYPIWRDFYYEYEKGKLPIDVINGGPFLRDWVDDSESTPADFERTLLVDEKSWFMERRTSLIYN